MKNYFLLSFLSCTILIFSSCNEEDQVAEEEVEGTTETTETSEIEIIAFTGEIYSCADFLVHILQSDEDTQRVLSISGETREALMLTEEEQTFELPLENINVEIGDYDLPLNNDVFCNDIAFDPFPQQIDSYVVVSGTLTLSVSNVEESESFISPYNISILLENAVFENVEGVQLKVESLVLEDLLVGWYPG